MLQLTAQQEETLHKLETASFNEFCKRAGKDATSYAALVGDVLIDELKTVIHIADADDGIPQSLSDHFRSAIQESDMFKRIRIIENHANATRLSHIIGGAPRQMINYSYLLSLAEALRLPVPSPANDNALRLLLDSLPLRLMWDNNFNAFVKRETLLDNIPCICVFHTITSGLKTLAHLVATAVIELGDPLPIVIRCRDMRNDASFKTDCREVLRAIFGEGDLLIPLHKEYAYGYRDAIHMYLYTQLVSGAFDFVWLHEYGHLLLGHLLTGPSHRVEFEADEFATATMFRAVETFPKYEMVRAAQPEMIEDLVHFDRTLYLCGAALSLSVLCLFDLFRMGDSPTHPLGKARVHNIAKRYPEIEILNFVRNVHQALNPTLGDYWSVTAKID